MKYVVIKSDFGYKVVVADKAPNSELTLNSEWFAGATIEADSPLEALNQAQGCEVFKENDR